MLLEIDALDVSYGRAHAVRGVALSVAAGEIVTVLGANGAGKSSLLKAILGIEPPRAGTVRFAGSDVTRAPVAERLRAGLALVPEGRRILVGLSVYENLRLGAYRRADRRGVDAEIDEIFARFPNLRARRDAPAAVLSGGEQQMLAIGRALLARPRLLMLDEPSLGLSPLLVDRLFATLGELHRDGIALLIVEQNTRKTLAFAQRGYVLELGRVVAQGAADTLLADPAVRAAYLGSDA